MNPIFEYTDYRIFLKDRFLKIKMKNPAFSYRAFNYRAGVKSSAFLKLVIDGKRNLGEEGIGKVIQGFRLSEGEAEFFRKLVYFNQADNHTEKDRHFQDLARLRPFRKSKPMTAAQYEMFSHWYYVTILELIRLEGPEIHNDVWLQQKIAPKVGLREIQKAIRILKSLNLIEVEENGNIRRLESMLNTEDQVRSMFLINYHQEMSKLAADVLTRVPYDQREFSGLTIAVGSKSFEKAKEEIQKFRKKLHDILEEEEDNSKKIVLQCNLQLFPLSEFGAAL